MAKNEVGTSLIKPEAVTALRSAETRCHSLAGMKVGIDKMLALGEAQQSIKAVLDQPEVQQMIMGLKGSALGFKTDERKGYGNKAGVQYGWDIVRDAVTQGLIHGVYPIQNQMNIISGSCYITKEGLDFKLSNEAEVLEKLEYRHIEDKKCGEYNQRTKTLDVEISVTFKLKGSDEETKKLTVPVIWYPDSGSIDQAFGKAERKAWSWLYQRITGAKVPDGDIERTVDEGTITVDAQIISDDEQYIANQDIEYLNELLKSPAFDDQTRAGWQKAIPNLKPADVEKNIAALVKHIITTGHAVPERKGE